MDDRFLYDVFDSDGLLSRSLEGYEYRESQLLMSMDVAEAFFGHSDAAIEAGTGIGKSLAYLVPAFRIAKDRPKSRTVIATSTINLQNQLIQKDIPLVKKVLGSDCRVELAVGRNNYLCLRRFSDVLGENGLLAQDSASAFGQLESFVETTVSGLRSDFKGRLDPALWSQINSDGDMCMAQHCPYFAECFYFKAKKKLKDASIIVCNHHLLFLDSHTRHNEGLAYDQDNVLPAFENLVVDEAHNMERHATDLFSETFSSYLVRRELDHIHNPKAGVGHVDVLDKLAPQCRDKRLYEDALDFMSLTATKADTVNLVLLSYLDVNRRGHQLVPAESASAFTSQFKGPVDEFVEASARLASKLKMFAEKCDVEDPNDFRLAELSVHTQRLSNLTDLLRKWFDVSKWGPEVHFLETERHGSTRYALVNTAPLEVGPLLKEALFSSIGSVVCTSATLNLNDGFGFWMNSVGLPSQKKLAKKTYPSPFDYKSRLMLLTPYDAPDFNKDNVEQYTDFLCDTVYKAVSSAGGGSLVLFTSFAMMEAVHNSLRPMFEAMDLTCMKQGEDDRYSLLQRFKEDTDSILFATDSFWEGVDAPGDTLRLVIIAKLPFRMPDEPIYRARLTKIESEGKSGFATLQLPDATMRLKQGFGRLMRHTSDKGIVLILDSRVVRKNYGSWMLSSLPECYHPECSLEGIPEKIESFLY